MSNRVHCQNCGSPVSSNDSYCPECGAQLGGSASSDFGAAASKQQAFNEQRTPPSHSSGTYTSVQHPQQRGQQAPAASYSGSYQAGSPQAQQGMQHGGRPVVGYYPRRDPTLAAVLSFLIPGIGYCIPDRVGRGIAWLIMCTILYFSIFGIPIAFILHIYSIFDSHSMTKRYNMMHGHPY